MKKKQFGDYRSGLGVWSLEFEGSGFGFGFWIRGYKVSWFGVLGVRIGNWSLRFRGLGFRV